MFYLGVLLSRSAYAFFYAVLLTRSARPFFYAVLLTRSSIVLLNLTFYPLFLSLQVFKLILYYLFDSYVLYAEWVLSDSFMIFLSHLFLDKLISLFGQYDFCKNIFCPYRLAVSV